MKKLNILYALMAVMLVSAVWSCKKDPKVGGTAVQELSGEWWVTTTGSDGSKSGYYALSTYNTAANRPDSMWINDFNNYYGLKARINSDPNALTFSANAATELFYNVKVTITDGKVLKNAATAPGSKDKTDSIYFKAVFTGDATVYTYAGYKRTGFSQDDH